MTVVDGARWASAALSSVAFEDLATHNFGGIPHKGRAVRPLGRYGSWLGCLMVGGVPYTWLNV